jgi:hypothetical protein
MLDDADLVVEALHPAVRDAETDGGKHAVTVLAEGTAELHERCEVGAARPGEPGAQVLRRGARAPAVESPELLLQQVGPEDASVQAGDSGEPYVLLVPEESPM